MSILYYIFMRMKSNKAAHFSFGRGEKGLKESYLLEDHRFLEKWKETCGEKLGACVWRKSEV